MTEFECELDVKGRVFSLTVFFDIARVMIEYIGLNIHFDWLIDWWWTMDDDWLRSVEMSYDAFCIYAHVHLLFEPSLYSCANESLVTTLEDERKTRMTSKGSHRISINLSNDSKRRIDSAACRNDIIMCECHLPPWSSHQHRQPSPFRAKGGWRDRVGSLFKGVILHHHHPAALTRGSYLNMRVALNHKRYSNVAMMLDLHLSIIGKIGLVFIFTRHHMKPSSCSVSVGSWSIWRRLHAGVWRHPSIPQVSLDPGRVRNGYSSHDADADGEPNCVDQLLAPPGTPVWLKQAGIHCLLTVFAAAGHADGHARQPRTTTKEYWRWHHLWLVVAVCWYVVVAILVPVNKNLIKWPISKNVDKWVQRFQSIWKRKSSMLHTREIVWYTIGLMPTRSANLLTIRLFHLHLLFLTINMNDKQLNESTAS